MFVLLILVALLAVALYGCFAWSKWQENLESQAEKGLPSAKELLERYRWVIMVVGFAASIIVWVMLVWYYPRSDSYTPRNRYGRPFNIELFRDIFDPRRW